MFKCIILTKNNRKVWFKNEFTNYYYFFSIIFYDFDVNIRNFDYFNDCLFQILKTIACCISCVEQNNNFVVRKFNIFECNCVCHVFRYFNEIHRFNVNIIKIDIKIEKHLNKQSMLLNQKRSKNSKIFFDFLIQ